MIKSEIFAYLSYKIDLTLYLYHITPKVVELESKKHNIRLSSYFLNNVKKQ